MLIQITVSHDPKLPVGSEWKIQKFSRTVLFWKNSKIEYELHNVKDIDFATFQVWIITEDFLTIKGDIVHEGQGSFI